MGRADTPVDPKIAKRRQKNKLASAKCRERKIKRAQLLQQEVAELKMEVSDKHKKLDHITTEIDKYKQFLENHKDALKQEEIQVLQAMFHKITSIEEKAATQQSTSSQIPMVQMAQGTTTEEEDADDSDMDDDESIEDEDSYQPQMNERPGTVKKKTRSPCSTPS